jgi:E3 ubiquitin-protein ligase SHPRH
VEHHDSDKIVWTLKSAIGSTIRLVSPLSDFDELEVLYPLNDTTRLRSQFRNRSNDIAFQDVAILTPHAPNSTFQVHAQIKWKIGSSPFDGVYTKNMKVKTESELLAKYLPVEEEATQPWSLQDFYESVYVPPKKADPSPRIRQILSECKLYPFQERAVDWLLRREGVQYIDDILQPVVDEEVAPASFRYVQDVEGKKCYVSHVRGAVVTDLNLLGDTQLSLRGGILAEEMGLGKTVELIALISSHTTDIHNVRIFDDRSQSTVTASKSTLIITPNSILEQWKNEISNHAPHLKVIEYNGLPAAHASEKKHITASLENLLQYDVVLTTYHVLAREIHYAGKKPDRELRGEKKYAARRSPLTEIQWWRVCLDEAQMIESGVSQAATVARLIPRVNAWAVSGTPLKKDVQDLHGLLIFLRFEPYASSKVFWQRIDKSTFRQIFGRIALRHTKDKIRNELQLPPQKRMVITVPFTPIEEQNYADLVRQMCHDCGLSAEGAPLHEQWNPNDPLVIETMRTWLVRLRQTCLHPQVGGRNRRALGGKGPLRTVAEVLDLMIEQNEAEVRTREREHVLAVVGKGHIWANAGNLQDRARLALNIFQDALEEAETIVGERRREVKVEADSIEELKAQEKSKRKEKVRQEKDETDTEDEDGINTARLRVLRQGLRNALEVYHVCLFFVASAYFQIKSNKDITVPDTEEFHQLERMETDYYDKAKAVRKEILQEPHKKAEEWRAKLAAKTEKNGLARVGQIDQVDGFGGIENRKVIEKLDILFDVLNSQSKLITEWRAKVIEMLLHHLVDEDEGKETTGEEYEDSTKMQDEQYVYIMQLKALVTDRHQALTGQEDFLIKGETLQAKREAKADRGHAPKLFLELQAFRDRLEPMLKNQSLRAILSELKALTTNMEGLSKVGNARAAAERQILIKTMTEVQDLFNEEMKVLKDLEAEQDLFRQTMNHRLDFFAKLQEISDTVRPYKEELDEELDKRALEQKETLEMDTAKKLAAAKTKNRFLLHLKEESDEEGQRLCIICQDNFETGVLTVCGHRFCKDCIRLWWRQNRTCPTCKRHLSSNDFHDITYRPQELKAQEENAQTPEWPSSSPSSHNTSIYSDISRSIMDEIKSVDLNSSHGSKIDTLARHILWLRSNDPGSKSIIFSQFSDFLTVLGDAFKKLRIGFSRIGTPRGIKQFREDASVECFLLDAKSDSSGLNLVNATHVFLCEPLINAAIELQAIARVHRIGQHRQTTVYMYLVSDTVEEAIYDISVSRRLAHMSTRGSVANTTASTSVAASASNSRAATRAGTPAASGILQETVLDAANSLELQKAPLAKLLVTGKSGGEMVAEDDLWNCLFGKTREDKADIVSEQTEREVGRFLRAEAAERRRVDLALRGNSTEVRS